jgi:hypothetical protein
MNPQSIHADQINFQDVPTDRQLTDGVSLLPGFIGIYQDAQRIKREARHVYAMNDTDLRDAGISSREDIPAHPAKMYR